MTNNPNSSTPLRGDLSLLANAAAQTQELLDLREQREPHLNSERRAQWRNRCLMQIGHWPDGNVAQWRVVCWDQDGYPWTELDDDRPDCGSLFAILWAALVGLVFYALLYAGLTYAEDYRVEMPPPVEQSAPGC